jgi:uncharacterized Zn finger protein
MLEEPRLADDIDPNKLLVEIVQGLLMAHARLDHMETALQTNINHLRIEGMPGLAAEVKASRLAEQRHFDEMLGRLIHLISNDAAQKTSELAESTKQNENWKNLQQFLEGFQKASATSATSLKKHTTDETKSLSSQISAIVELINTSDANHYANFRQLRITLYWLIFFSASLIGLIAATTFKVWIR